MTRGPENAFVWAPLAPECLVADLAASLRFWCGLCSFRIAYDRPDETFAYLDLNGAQLMLEQQGAGRQWVTGTLERPLGRGINFQIWVPAIEPLLNRLAAGGWPLFMSPEEKWYRAGTIEVGQRQFLVQDPDGYVIRFAAHLGQRPAA